MTKEKVTYVCSEKIPGFKKFITDYEFNRLGTVDKLYYIKIYRSDNIATNQSSLNKDLNDWFNKINFNKFKNNLNRIVN